MFSIIFLISTFFILSCESKNNNLIDKSILEELPWSKRIAQSFVKRHPGSVTYNDHIPKKIGIMNKV